MIPALVVGAGPAGLAVSRELQRRGVEHLVLALLRGDDKVSQGLFQQLGVAPKETRDLVLADLRSAA